MTPAMTCPDRAYLERLIECGGSEEAERLAEHLETCGRCGDTVEELLAADRTAAVLRGTRVMADSPSVQLLRERLTRLRPVAGAPGATPPADAQATAAAAPPREAPLEATEGPDASLAPPQQPDEIGRLGGYRILKELGRGGMGVVYQAEDPKLKRTVALKAMLPSVAADVSHRQRFLREAQAMAAVHHDHIVTIFEVDEDNGVPFLAMEFLQGVPLDKWLKQGCKPSVAQVLRIGREIAEGLGAAHEHGLIHRDIKPGNIWLDSRHRGRVKILDFGLARSGKEDVHLTRSGAIMGTPAYMAPEQARAEKVDTRSDLFSLGCVLYRLCTGAMPFSGDNTMALLMALALDNPKPVRDLNPDVPAALADLVMRLLAKDPAQQPQSAREVTQAIQAIGRASSAAFSPTVSAAIPPPAPASPAPPARSGRGAGKRGAWIMAIVAAGLLATAVAATVVIIRDKDGNKIAEAHVPPGGKVTVVDDGKNGDAAVAAEPSVDDAWVKQVAALPAEKQAAAVAAKLKELNPGFDGGLTPTVENGVATGLQFRAFGVTNLSPLRALNGLRSLTCGGWGDYAPLSDLSPLRGMNLTTLSIPYSRVADLAPLKGMPLKVLDCGFTPVSDLSPLAGLPLTELTCHQTAVADLTPLKGMPLTHLSCDDTKIADLSPLKGLKLDKLWVARTRVSDLSPLKGMPLTFLACGGAKVVDLSPLKGSSLRWIECDFLPDRDAAVLRSIPTLETINARPVKDLWEDAGKK